MKNLRLAAVTAWMMLSAATAQAVTILSSYSAGASDQTGRIFAVSNTKWEAVSFVTGPVGSYSLDSVTMRLVGAPGALVEVGIYGTGSCVAVYSCLPTNFLGSLGSIDIGAKGEYKFAGASDIELAPSNKYFVIFKGLTAVEANYFEYRYPGDPWYSPFQSDVGAHIHDFWKSPSAFAPGILGVDWMAHSGLNLIGIEGTLLAQPVSEPSTYASMLAGLFAVGAVARRRLSGARTGCPTKVS